MNQTNEAARVDVTAPGTNGVAVQFANMLHRHGGRITELSTIEHATDEFGAWWQFRGRVEWDDGSASDDAHITPICICQDSEAGQAEVQTAMDALSEYLRTHGRWAERGNWKPKARKGSEPFAAALARVQGGAS